jgi:TonB-linked SusC/RagA family outer membrane protein
MLHSLAITALVPVALQAQATITGRVTAAGTNQPLVDARVMVVSTNLVAIANADGRYTLRNVPNGNLEIRALRVGYQEQKKPIVITSGQAATLDFTMVDAVVQLSEIVTTATGEQRRVEIGNAVTTLGDITKKVETQPVTNIGDLMVAKAPGVIVLPGVMTGAAPQIRVRGLGSLATAGSGISNNPIYVIDGVRMANNNVSLNTGGTQASLLNDIDPNEIEDIEIVKGPSAATLYGTDAANGVVVITTRKGRAGATRWSWYGEGGSVSDRNGYWSTYASWGHDSTGKLTRCTLITESQNKCTLDSLTSFNVMTNPSTTSLHLGHRDGYGMNASGGTEQVRFFLSGDMSNEIGPINMPQFARASLVSSGTPLRDEWVNPEAFQAENFRANLTAAFTPKLDVNVSTGFSNTNQRLPQVDNNIFSFEYSALNNPGFNHDGLNYTEAGTLGENRNGYGGFSPAQIFQFLNQNQTQRFIGSTDATWRPLAWMQNEGTVGLDLANNDFLSLCRFGECPNSGTRRQGGVTNAQTNFRNLSAKIVSNMTWQARQDLSFKSTLGADYTNLETDGVSVTGTNLPPGAQAPSQAAVITSGTNTDLQTVNKTLGLYVQEQASFRDRLFLVGALRTDQNSSFGTNFQRVVYPKASLSWIISDEPWFPRYHAINSFRIRSAFGESGVQPGGTVALQTYASSTSNIATVPGSTTSTDTPGLRQNALGNSDLKPERSSETEAGFETGLWNNRVHLDATYYHKKTSDALISLPIASSSGAAATSVLANLASTSNSGYELTVNTTLLDLRTIGWDVTIAGSHNSQKILALGNDLAGKPVATIVSGSTRDSIGLPINAFVVHPYTYADANKDGIITPNEVTVGTGFTYAGYSQPRDIVSITNGFDVLNRKIRITVLTDYKGGYSLYNQSSQFYATNFATWYSENVKSTPLWDQARNVASSSASNPTTVMGYIENGQFWKLREVSAALTLPDRLAQRIRARDAQLVFSARNLHTWTSYTGVDPESNYGTGDVQTDFSTLAPRTSLNLRLNLHF